MSAVLEHVEVCSYEALGDLTRAGDGYFVDCQKVTLKQAFLWYVQMEKKGDGQHANIREMNRFLKAVARLLK